jgi:ParB family chromosome partitioning protein
MKIQQKKTAELIPYARNSRTHDEKQVQQIAASIKEFGFNNPVLIDGDNGIIAGHGRVMAAQLLKLETVPTIELSHLSETQKRAYIIADNKIALNSGWDDEMLKLEMIELNDLDFNLELTGFDDFALDDDFEGFEAEEVEMPELRSGDREPFQQMTFTLHDEQAEQIKQAMELSKSFGDFDSLNQNNNGNALARIAETYLTQNANR